MAETEATVPKTNLETSAEDRAIGDAISSGDHRTALSLCARHHGTAIGRLCMAMVGSSSEADDLVQETLIDAHAGFAGFRGEGSIRAWLLAIARRKCARHLERTARRTSRLRLVHDSERGDGAEEMIERRRRAERARAALSTIRPSEREALVLRYASELSFREVGIACGVEEATARKRVSRALAKLRDAVGSKE
ncbi:MAG: RNA polymerase sigma factor [Myxococcales bacterium]|nr:RNA polymerase sigma factor [Myxococcales bacterium]MCB9575911.1 RNA polymerase sigma factor [Polyangiaceae bacterium]